MEREIAGLRRRLATNTNHHGHAVQVNVGDGVSQPAGSAIWDPASATLNQGKALSTSIGTQVITTSKLCIP